MGIKGLYARLLKLKYKPSMIDGKLFYGQTFAIDTSIYLYKGNYGFDPVTNPKPLIAYILKMGKRLKVLGITSVFVFDGIPTKLKYDTNLKRSIDFKKNVDKIEKIEDRYSEEDFEMAFAIGDDLCLKAYRELKRLKKNMIRPLPEDILELKDALVLAGYRVINVDHHDAECFCGYLQRMGYVDQILTNDGDTLLWGNSIIKNWKPETEIFEVWDNTGVLKTFGFTKNSQLIDFGIICGCDYLQKGIVGIGPVYAQELCLWKDSHDNVIRKKYEKKYEKKYNELTNTSLYLKIFAEFVYEFNSDEVNDVMSYILPLPNIQKLRLMYANYPLIVKLLPKE